MTNSSERKAKAPKLFCAPFFVQLKASSATKKPFLVETRWRANSPDFPFSKVWHRFDRFPTVNEAIQAIALQQQKWPEFDFRMGEQISQVRS